MTRLMLTIAVALLAAAGLSTGGAARDSATFNCPKNAGTKGTQNWVRNYQGFRGSTWCDDNATIRVTIGGKTLTFPEGLCTATKNGRYLQFGTRISPLKSRKPNDPAGAFVNDPKLASGLDKWGEFGKGAVKWQENVVITWTGPKTGKFSGIEGQWVNNVFTEVKATGTFACKRLVPVNF